MGLMVMVDCEDDRSTVNMRVSTSLIEIDQGQLGEGLLIVGGGQVNRRDRSRGGDGLTGIGKRIVREAFERGLLVSESKQGS